MKQILLLLDIFCMITLLTPPTNAQEYAEFSTDTTRFRHHRNEDGKLSEYLTEQVWFINGQKMTYGSGIIRVKVNPNKLDTVLYKGYRQKKMDTIICNISEAKKYKFYYNPCCGAFDVHEEGRRGRIGGSVLYKLKNPSYKTYLGTLGEAGILVSTNTKVLNSHCRSAMSPNIYPISFAQIVPCKNGVNCGEGTCLQKDNKESNHNYSYKTVSKKMDGLFMPLKDEPLIVVYDPNTGKINIK